jgi:hypothetical protein
MNPELNLDGFHVDAKSGTCIGSIGFSAPTQTYLFLRAILEKIPDITIMVPYNGIQYNWIDATSNEYKYSDIDQVWIDQNMRPFTFKDRYHNQRGKIAKVYIMEATSSQAMFNGEVVSLEELKKKKLETTQKIKELTELNNQIESSITKGMCP